MIAIRKILDCFFSEEELSILDDILPSFTRRKQLDDEDRKVRNSNFYSKPAGTDGSVKFDA